MHGSSALRTSLYLSLYLSQVAEEKNLFSRALRRLLQHDEPPEELPLHVRHHAGARSVQSSWPFGSGMEGADTDVDDG